MVNVHRVSCFLRLSGKYLYGYTVADTLGPRLAKHLLLQVQSSLGDKLNFPARCWLDLCFTSSSSSSLV